MPAFIMPSSRKGLEFLVTLLVAGITTIGLFLVGSTCASAAEPAAASPDFPVLLPPALYGVAGLRTEMYFDNLVLTQTPQNYRFEVTCDLPGQTNDVSWGVTPTPAQTGDHPLIVSVRDVAGTVVGTAKSVLHVAPADSGAGGRLKLLLVGDSLTMATVYPNEIARLLNQPGNPRWTMLGTNRPANAAPGVQHEGYGGWTWERFATGYEPNPDGTYRKRSSPFVFLETDRPTLNVERYLSENNGGAKPDVVTFLLGINDLFPFDPDKDGEAIEKRIHDVLTHADTLLAAFHRAAPDAILGVGLTTPPNTREEAFLNNYQGQYHRWGWKRIQFELVQREISHFDGRENEGIFLISTGFGLDPVNGLPPNNAVHPNATGYQQIANPIYAWLKYRFANR